MEKCSGKGIDNTVSDIEGMEVRATRGLELLAVEDKRVQGQLQNCPCSVSSAACHLKQGNCN